MALNTVANTGSGSSAGGGCANYILVDIGANLTNRKFARDLDSVISRARNSGVHKIMVTGTSVQVSHEALRLTRLYPDVLYFTAGVHPHDAKTWNDAADGSEWHLRRLAANPECVAVGECGLDFNRNFSPPETQLAVFEKQVALACELQKPLFVHERDAHSETVSVLRAAGRSADGLPPTVIHCFTGSAEQAQTYLHMGFYIGITGYIWKDKSNCGLRHALRDGVIPLDRLLLETDAPYMFPAVRGAKLPEDIRSRLSDDPARLVSRHCSFQRNEPCSLSATAELVAAYLQLPVYDVAMKTTYNAVKVFGLNS